MKKSSDLSMEAKGSGDRQRAKAAALMEPGFMGMAAATMAKKRTQPAPAQQANAAQKNMQNGSPSAQPTPYKTGGKVAKHDDAAADEKLFGKLFKAAEKKEPKGMKKGGKWIQSAVKKPGALHRELNVPMGQKIPMAKIDKAANSSNPTLAKRANFAKTVSKFAQGGAVPRGKVAKFAAGGTPTRMVPPQGGVAPPARPMPAGPVVETQRRAVPPPIVARPPMGGASGAQAPGSIPAPRPPMMTPMQQPVMRAMGGAGKIRKNEMTAAGKPIAQPKRGSSAYK